MSILMAFVIVASAWLLIKISDKYPDSNFGCAALLLALGFCLLLPLFFLLVLFFPMGSINPHRLNWSEFWTKPVFSLGGVLSFAFCVWIVQLWEKYHAERAEEIRRYREMYPLGEPRSRYELEYGKNEE